MNRVILVGRAAKDFDLRYTSSGVAVANGTIAVDRPFQKDKEKESDFINLVAWRQTAEIAANHIRKGHRFGLEGSIQVRSYEKDGQKRYITEVLVERVEFLESRQESKKEHVVTSTHSNGQSSAYGHEDYPDGLPF